MDDYGHRDLTHVLPNHINEEAVVLRGCTATEVIIITALSTIFWVTTTFIIGTSVGLLYPILGSSVLLMLFTVFVISSVFQIVKRGQAPGHYQQLVSLFMGRIGMKRSSFVLHDGPLSVGRTKQIVLVKQHLKAPEHDDM